MDESILQQFREHLTAALEISDRTERMLEVAAVISYAVDDLGLRPVVVGGLAVAAWVSDAYLTADIDVVMPHLPAADDRLAALGFVREGREWVLPGADLAFEVPGSSLSPVERFEEIELASERLVRVLSPEDLLVYRLHEFVAGGHLESFRHVVWLLGVPGLDRSRLDERAGAERLATALREVERIAERHRGSGLPPGGLGAPRPRAWVAEAGARLRRP